jgi:hypothetical protein
VECLTGFAWAPPLTMRILLPVGEIDLGEQIIPGEDLVLGAGMLAKAE